MTQALIILIALFAAAQFVRPERANPPVDPGRTLRGQVGSAPAVTVIERACSDCHSNATVWPPYTQVAPVSWLMVYAVRKGRGVVNFSDWASYPPGVQQTLLEVSCRDVSTNKMPGVYTMLHPEMRLSPQDIDTICGLARGAQAGNTK
jgi:hypothetical protein